MHVGHYRRWLFARQHALEVAARQAVLALEKERPCQFQAHPHQAGAGDQHGVERGDGLVQQRLPLVVGKIGLLRCAGRCQADEEEHVRLDRAAPGQRPQDAQRLLEPALLNQGPALRDAGLASSRRLLSSAPRRSGEEKKGRGRQGAQERADCHRVLTGGVFAEKKEGGRTCHPHREVRSYRVRFS